MGKIIAYRCELKIRLNEVSSGKLKELKYMTIIIIIIAISFLKRAMVSTQLKKHCSVLSWIFYFGSDLV